MGRSSEEPTARFSLGATAVMTAVLLALPTISEFAGDDPPAEGLRSGMALGVVVLAALHLLVGRLDRNDPIARTLGATSVAGCMAVLASGSLPALVVAPLPTLLLFVSGIEATSRGLFRTLVGLAGLSLLNVGATLSPAIEDQLSWLGGPSSQGLLAGGTIATAAVSNLVGRRHRGTRALGVVAYVCSLTTLLLLEPGTVSPGLLAMSIVFALPAIVVAGVEASDGQSRSESV